MEKPTLLHPTPQQFRSDLSQQRLGSHVSTTREGNNSKYVLRISTNYTPSVGDLLLRDEVVGQYGIVKEIFPPDASGKRRIKVWERNYKCKGAIQKKTYYLKNGAFEPNRYAEPSFDYFLKEVAN